MAAPFDPNPFDDQIFDCQDFPSRFRSKDRDYKNTTRHYPPRPTRP